jgi:uncharacterized protein (DUF2141 family)
MKVLQIIKYGELIDSLSINEIEKPLIKATDILIEPKAAALSPSDYKMVNNILYKLFFRNTEQSEMLCFSRKSSRLLFWLALSLVWLPSNGFAQTECPSINVKIQNISNNTGVIACAIFESEKGFPGKFLKFASKTMITQITGKDASFEFSDIKPGKYAIAVIHDENCNGKLDTNMFGIPKEGYGFSSGAEVAMSAPSFSDAVFSYDRGHLQMSISLNY